MNNGYFDYPTPYLYELKEMYQTPYRFSSELTLYIEFMFMHPVHNKFHLLFENLKKPTDANDMAKPAYLITKYYLDHPQQFGHSLENITPQIIVSMWKAFIGIHKHLRGVQFSQYYPASMKLLTIGKDHLLDKLIDEITNSKFIMHGDDMVKKRDDYGLREKGQKTKEGTRNFEWMCKLAENESGSLL